MSTMARAHLQASNNSTVRLDPSMVANLTSVRDELYKRVTTGVLPGRKSIAEVFADLFGSDLPRAEQVRILFFAAPLVRRIVLDETDANVSIGVNDITYGDVKSWLWWIDVMDPLCARMIDLHYFAALSIKETAAVLHLPPSAIIRELRFARSWLRIRVPTYEA